MLVEDDANFNDIVFRKQVGDLITLVVPGIIGGLCKVATGDYKVGHLLIQNKTRGLVMVKFKTIGTVSGQLPPILVGWDCEVFYLNNFYSSVTEICLQLRVLMAVLILEGRHFMLQICVVTFVGSAVSQQALCVADVFAGVGTLQPNSKEGMEILLNSQEQRSPKWLKASARKLLAQTQVIVRVQHSDHWRVRLELVQMCDHVLTHCSRFLIHLDISVTCWAQPCNSLWGEGGGILAGVGGKLSSSESFSNISCRRMLAKSHFIWFQGIEMESH
uniref:TTI1 N-terminal TPR domain-containing protein n=1 Tax=Timema cristinae TaxID=61476 RepID=A0A7R9GQD1_TIMCR|nr:unnamed protein product [Timema cristinae]